jgi:hypothetical protein
MFQASQWDNPNAILALIGQLSGGKNHQKRWVSHFFAVYHLFEFE